MFRSDAGGGARIAVMLRSNVFPAARSRALFGKPSPEEVYDTVNGIVAHGLAERGLVFPAFEDCVSA